MNEFSRNTTVKYGNYAIFHNGPSRRRPRRRQSMPNKTASIIARNENEYIRGNTLNLSIYALCHERCSSNTESVSSRLFLEISLTARGPSQKSVKKKETMQVESCKISQYQKYIEKDKGEIKFYNNQYHIPHFINSI